MNIILLDEEEVARGLLPADDGRGQHIGRVLRAGAGAQLKAGVVGGAIGVLHLEQWTAAGWRFTFSPQKAAPLPFPLTVLLAISRPPTMRRLLRDLASLGCQAVLIFPARLGEGDYSRSHLWQQVPSLLREGAQQGVQTHLPRWQLASDLAEALRLAPSGLWCDCLPSPPLLTAKLSWPLALAIGPERGWSAGERQLAADCGWQTVSLAGAVLRCELATQLAVGMLRQRWEIG